MKHNNPDAARSAFSAYLDQMSEQSPSSKELCEQWRKLEKSRVRREGGRHEQLEPRLQL